MWLARGSGKYETHHLGAPSTTLWKYFIELTLIQALVVILLRGFRHKQNVIQSSPFSPLYICIWCLFLANEASVSCKPAHLKASNDEGSAQGPEPPELSMNPEGTSVHRTLVGLDRVIIFTTRLLASGTLWKEWREGRKVISAGMTMSPLWRWYKYKVDTYSSPLWDSWELSSKFSTSCPNQLCWAWDLSLRPRTNKTPPNIVATCPWYAQ